LCWKKKRWSCCIHQGDQIAQCVIVNFGKLLENYRTTLLHGLV
jgi:hypothetical protein